jgi:N-formylglutamate deformylase
MIPKIIHIPHSSTYIPDEYLSDYLISKDELEKECDIMKDDYTDYIVSDYTDNPLIEVVKFPYSRVFCDVERFNNEQEEMNKVGMGVLYTHSHDCKLIRYVKNGEDIIKIYDEHHKLLNDITTKLLSYNKQIMVLDIHSYSNIPLPYELHKDLNRPDICIGLNDNYDEKTIGDILYIIKNSGFSYSINEPFIGCLIPVEYIDNKNVIGVMLEFNKNVLYSHIEKIKELTRCIIKI